jgi:hypothetical protein
MTGTVYKLHGVQFDDYTTCDSALEVCGIQTVNQVLDEHLTRPEEEAGEYKATFLDGLEANRMDMCQFDTEINIILMCNEVENELYKTVNSTKKKQKTLTEWLKK